MSKVTGVVEAIGQKFNGSLKIGDKWLNLKKGVKNTANVGDMVTLTLEPWEFKGKTGESITGIDVLAGAPAPAPTIVKESKAAAPSYSGRDFDKEAHGKTRHGILCALLSNPSVDAMNPEKLFPIVDKCVEYVFKK